MSINSEITQTKKDQAVHVEYLNEDGELSNVITRYHSFTLEQTAAIEKSLVRKIDLRILPVLVLIYVLNYLDRNSITQARLYGLQQDAHVTGAVWNTAISILSAGYIAMQIPSTILMPKVRPSLFLPICMIIWAIVSGCTAFVSSPGGLLAVRFVLGVAEAPFFPCAIYYLSCWYKKSELGIRMAALVSGLVLSNAFSGLLAAGILKGMAGVGSLHAWQWLFILEGLATIVVAVAAIFLLADYPSTTRWLTKEERMVAEARLAIDIGSEDSLDHEKIPVLRSIAMAAKDYRVWLFAFMQMAVTASISYSHFFPTVIQQLGFKDRTVTLLLTSPPYVVAFFWSVGCAWYADKKQVRSPFAGTSAVMALVGAVILVSIPQDRQWARYAMTFLLTCGTYGVYSTTYTWLSSTLPRPPAKRAAAIGIANSLANLASFYGNYFWLDQYEPAYTQSWVCVIAFLVLAVGLIVTIRVVLSRRNRRFEALAEQRAAAGLGEADPGLSEEDHRGVYQGFRYVI